jgi:hypothetical protein
MGCFQSKPIYKARRKRARRGNRSKRNNSVQRQHISPQYPEDEDYPVYQDYGQDQQGVINNEQTMLEYPNTRRTSQFQPNTEYLAIENDTPTIQQDMANPQQTRREGHSDLPLRTPVKPHVSDDYMKVDNRRVSNSLNYNAPHHSDINPVYRPYPSTPPPASNVEEHEAANRGFSLASPDIVPGAAEISKVNDDHVIAKRSIDYENFPQRGISHERSDSTLKRELEALSMQVDITTPAKVVSKSYEIPSERETEYETPEEKSAKVVDTAHRIPHRADNTPQEVVDSTNRIPYRADIVPQQKQPVDRESPYSPIRNPELHVPRSLESTEPRPPRAKDIGNICIDGRTGEYKYYQRGIHMGNVDKETAEKFSKDWPICPGTAVKHERLQSRAQLGQRNGGNREIYVPSEGRFGDDGPHGMFYGDRPSLYEPMGGYRAENNRYMSQAYKRQVLAQPSPGYRGYYM